MLGSMEAPVKSPFGDVGARAFHGGFSSDAEPEESGLLGDLEPCDFEPCDFEPDDFEPGSDSTVERVTPVMSVGFSIAGATQAQHAVNRAMAAQLSELASALQTARDNPSSYLLPGGLAEPDAPELAARAAALDASLQLNLSANQVRNRAYEGSVLARSLPRLLAQFRLGLTSYAHAQLAVQQLSGLSEPAAIARYDAALAVAALSMTPPAFRRKARTLAERLRAEPAAARHGRALAERRVDLEAAEDGMAWLHILASAPDAIRVKARLDATARSVRRSGTPERRTERRTLSQIRSDLAVAWLAGDGTPTAARVRPMLLVPILSLLDQKHPDSQKHPDDQKHPAGQRTSGRRHQDAVLQGYGPIDPVSAARLFHDAPSFRRVGTDPFTGEILDLDRTKYRPTAAQRSWLSLKYGICALRDCEQPVAQTDIDHLREWSRDLGPTNIANLIPLCAPAHRLKTLSRITFSRNEHDDTLEVRTPTGFLATRTPPGYLDDDGPPF